MSILFLVATCVATRAHANDDDAPQSVGVTAQGVHGIHRIAVPYAPSKHITLSGQGGWGFTESVGDVDGAHQRLFGKIAAGFSPLHWLGFGLYLDGYYDKHPADDDGADSTLIGNPHLNLRLGHALTDLVQLGVDFDLWIPGTKAPSFDWDATTLDSRVLFALSPKGGFWTIAAIAGFRLDNSGNSAPAPETLRIGDRISLGVSDFHAVLLGLGTSLRFAAFELLIEFTANVLVGDGAPTGSSPMHIGLGGRYHITDGLRIELMTDTLASARPELGVDSPMVPVDPRFSLLLGVRYSFSLGQEPTPAPTPEEPPPPVVEPPTPPPPSEEPPSVVLTPFAGSVVDNEQNPIGGAVVTLKSGDQVIEAKTDGTGQYRFDEVPEGPATLTVAIDGFDESTRDVTIGKDMPPSDPLVLTETEASQASQLRGIIRSLDGNPLKATLIIKPDNVEVETDEEGYVTVDLPPGNYTVIIKSKGYRRQSRKVEIEENSVTILNADLRKRK